MKVGRCPAHTIVSSYLLHFTNERGSGLLQTGGCLGQGLATMPRPAGVRSGLCVLTTTQNKGMSRGDNGFILFKWGELLLSLLLKRLGFNAFDSIFHWKEMLATLGQ